MKITRTINDKEYKLLLLFFTNFRYSNKELEITIKLLPNIFIKYYACNTNLFNTNYIAISFEWLIWKIRLGLAIKSK